MPGDSWEWLRAGLAATGFDRVGIVTREAWDRLQPEPLHVARLLPEARSAFVVGCGGRALFEAVQARGLAGPDPVDAFTEAEIARRAAALEAAGHRVRAVFAHRPEAGTYLDFVALGREAGLGWPSRLGLLLHPEVGPWMSLRAALLVDAALEGPGPLPGPGPCEGCPAPCQGACPASALPARGFEIEACAAKRRSDPGCRDRCAARRACVVGPEHAYSQAAEGHHMAAAARAMGIPRLKSVPPGDS
ncbi:MAG: hypothetical protein QNK05_04855 [Myxococcota bacterium]|nr:hypothetical protein [Myxococcota bacterium]